MLIGMKRDNTRVSPNVMYKLGREIENIVMSRNYIGKHGQQTKDGTVREFARHVISSFQTWTACNEYESLYEHRVVGYPLHLRPIERKWMYRYSVVWGKISNETATESSNVHLGASEPGGTWMF
ncbi:hypothetical protein TNCV_3167231 [Trichonephila clavipes]|uniref:Uncharacterized protein n=1 Tax=Trichonephila clavipes TaxID=2585209 RepID=A0A8X6RE51_TRICX|nr:hypothetical protein TNCV_3167231 [Trichonephila clavipes]